MSPTDPTPRTGEGNRSANVLVFMLIAVALGVTIGIWIVTR